MALSGPRGGGEVDLDLEALHEIHDSMHLGHAGDQKKAGEAKVAAASSPEQPAR